MSSIQDVLDRMTQGSATSESPPFLPSSTWKGAKPGYYFGTGQQGTGYYLDTHTTSSSSPPTKKRRTVQIAEYQNEMKFIPKRPPTSQSLLDEAEARAKERHVTVLDLTPKALKSATNALVKLVQQNTVQRTEHADDPSQYMESEIALYEQLTALQSLAANAELYKMIAQDDSSLLWTTLTELLGHENPDVSASVVAWFLECLDPTLAMTNTAVAALARRLLIESWETLVWNLTRFGTSSGSEDDDPSLQGVDNTLSLMENLLELDLINGLIPNEDGDEMMSAAAYMAKESKVVSWLFQQVEKDEGQLKGRCMELLAVVAQREDVHTFLPDWTALPPTESDSDPGKKSNDKSIQGIEIILQCIGAFRKKQPASEEEVEFLENACIVLSSCISFSTANLSAFLKGQGIELMVRCFKEGVHAGGCGLKLLDFVGAETIHKEATEQMVEAGALKYLFPMLLVTRFPKPAPLQQNQTSKVKREWLQMIETQTIRILYALTRFLDEKSPNDAQARFLSKFVQDERKCDRLVELLLSYDRKSRKTEYKFYRSDVEEEVQEEETIQLAALEAKLQGGGDLFHRVGAILACICVHSKRCHERIVSQLHLQQSGISTIKAAIEEFVSMLDPESAQARQLESYLMQL